jgi:hypothetical protein
VWFCSNKIYLQNKKSTHRPEFADSISEKPTGIFMDKMVWQSGFALKSYEKWRNGKGQTKTGLTLSK